jgi:hypothetical protein
LKLGRKELKAKHKELKVSRKETKAERKEMKISMIRNTCIFNRLASTRSSAPKVGQLSPRPNKGPFAAAALLRAIPI